MTRAREELYMIYASSRLLYGGVQPQSTQPVLSEISGDFQQQNPFGSLAGDAAGDEYNQDVRYVPELNAGDRVKHQLFGVGTCWRLTAKTLPSSLKTAGTKKLNIAFAPLEKL